MGGRRFGLARRLAGAKPAQALPEPLHDTVSLADKVGAEQVRLLYSDGGIALWTTAAVAAAMVLMLIQQRTLGIVPGAAFLGAMVLQTAARVALSIAGWLFALPLGTTIGIARTSSSRWVLGLSGFYVSVFRNIPLLLQMFVWFFVVPELLPAKLGLWFKRDLPNPEFWTAALALAFYTSGRLAELFRAGLQAVRAGRAWPPMQPA